MILALLQLGVLHNFESLEQFEQIAEIVPIQDKQARDDLRTEFKRQHEKFYLVRLYY